MAKDVNKPPGGTETAGVSRVPSEGKLNATGRNSGNPGSPQKAHPEPVVSDSQTPLGEADTLARIQKVLAQDDPDLAGSPACLVGCLGRRKLLSPFEVHFSQTHIRPEFQDGRSVFDAVGQVRAQLCFPVAEEGGYGAPSTGEPWWLLELPFPEIEVIQWRCKLRGEDGTIKVDEMGAELYGQREWYSLDNRRLYCLQKAAVKFWPQEVRCAIAIVRQEDGSYREFRKFRTFDCGRSVGIGHRDDGDLPRWSWRREVGLAEEVMQAGTALVKPPRRRNSDRRLVGGKNSGRYKDDKDEDQAPWDFSMNLALFVLVYAILRSVFYISRRLTNAA